MTNPFPSESPVRIPIDIRRLPWVHRLASDYAYDFSRVAPFYSGDPSVYQSWADAIARTRTRERSRAALAGVLAAQQRLRDAPEPARRAAERLADPRTVVVMTGQQAGL